ncbi:MAG: fasciclin domain-containing protein, partial [Deltaproteobacteria bacterium]|nr:fasciclin domain-containing protein [Deltaproteobacteria bacterium]
MKLKIALVTLMLVLIPVGMAMAQQPTNMYDTLAAAGNFKTFLSAVDKANVQELKSMQGPFTVFAPTDAAFAKVPQATRDKIMGDPAIVRDVVFFHITPGKYLAKDLPALKECKTLCPTDNAGIMKFTKMGDKYMVNDAAIVKPDVMATNGVAQGIDA